MPPTKHITLPFYRYIDDLRRRQLIAYREYMIGSALRRALALSACLFELWITMCAQRLEIEVGVSRSRLSRHFN